MSCGFSPQKYCIAPSNAHLTEREVSAGKEKTEADTIIDSVGPSRATASRRIHVNVPPNPRRTGSHRTRKGSRVRPRRNAITPECDGGRLKIALRHDTPARTT